MEKGKVYYDGKNAFLVSEEGRARLSLLSKGNPGLHGSAWLTPEEMAELASALTEAAEDLAKAKAKGAKPFLTLGEMAIAVAMEEMEEGAGERGANNAGPYVAKYLSSLCEPPANWCAGFVSWCYHVAAKRMGHLGTPFPYTVGARSFLRYGREHGVTLDMPEKPGDVVVWWRESKEGWMGHVGMLVSRESLREPGPMTGRYLYRVIEGNKGAFPSKVRIFEYTTQELLRQGSDSGYLGACRFTKEGGFTA